MEKTIFSVSDVNKAIKQYIEGSDTFKNIFIQGELSNITYYKSGHLYFTLKDDKASVKCAIFKYAYKGVPTDLKEGDQVKIMGSATLYEANGTYQIIAETLEKTNKLGSLYEKLEQLKKYYFEKGYFDAGHKKRLPKLPMNVGVVTAATGAAIRDIINTTHKRNNNINIYLYAAKVQGEGSAEEVAAGIKFFNKEETINKLNIDVLIVGRGGGSIEDLWAFNEEAVIEAIFESKIPVVSAVGHEIDNLLSDLVADKRAATPTQAAEILIPEKNMLLRELQLRENTVNKQLLNKVNLMKKELEQRKNNYYIKNYINFLNDKKIDLINKEKMLDKLIVSHIEKLKRDLEYKSIKVSKYSVKDILDQGYTLTRKNGKIVKRGIELSKEDKIEIQFSDMKIKSIVK